jgi:hypothetical protein
MMVITQINSKGVAFLLLLVGYLLHTSAMKMEAVYSSERSSKFGVAMSLFVAPLLGTSSSAPVFGRYSSKACTYKKPL